MISTINSLSLSETGLWVAYSVTTGVTRSLCDVGPGKTTILSESEVEGV